MYVTNDPKKQKNNNNKTSARVKKKSFKNRFRLIIDIYDTVFIFIFLFKQLKILNIMHYLHCDILIPSNLIVTK